MVREEKIWICEECGEEIFEEYICVEGDIFCMECVENLSIKGLLGFLGVEILTII